MDLSPAADKVTFVGKAGNVIELHVTQQENILCGSITWGSWMTLPNPDAALNQPSTTENADRTVCLTFGFVQRIQRRQGESSHGSRLRRPRESNCATYQDKPKPWGIPTFSLCVPLPIHSLDGLSDREH